MSALEQDDSADWIMSALPTSPGPEAPPLPELKGEDEEAPEPSEPIALMPQSRASHPPNPTIDRLPPADVEAERAVLGSLLIDPACIADVMDVLSPADSSRVAHATIYSAAIRLYGRGEPPDVVLLNTELELAGALEVAGGPGYVAALGNETPTSVYAVQYAKIVADRSRERATIMAASRIAQAAYEHDPRLAESVSEIIAGLPRAAARPATTIGARTARDLLCGAAPEQLAEPFLTREGPVVIYARGGTGKGLVTCWLIKRLVAAGHVIMIIDFEGHEREWGSRLRGLGLADEQLARVHYRAPFAFDWTAPTGPLAAVADAIRIDAAALAVTYLVVDSYSVATSNGDTMGGEAAAREYFSGLARIGLPSTTIAHVRGDSGKFPDRPFGSVFVHNLARETWAVERVGDDTPETDPDLVRIGPHVVALELRNKKANARPITAAQFVTFSFFGDGTIEVATERPAARSVADMAADALAEGPLTIVKILAAIKEDTGQKVDENALRSALTRHPQRFVLVAGKRPRPWSLR
jgi:hypothetical protein